jgi:drug/metabolite transporter (DMT)-like permease
MTRRPVLATAPGTRPEAFGLSEWGLLMAVALIWGSSFLWVATGLDAFSPTVITLTRLVLGAAALALFPSARARVDRAAWPQIVALSLMWMSIPLLLVPLAQQRIDSSIAGAINGALPLFAAVLAALLLKASPGPLQVVGLLVGFSGVALVTFSGAGGSPGSIVGIALMLAATAMYSIGFNLSVPLSQRYGPMPVLFRAQLVSIALVLPFGVAGIPSSRWAWSSAGAVLVLGVVGTGLGYVASSTLNARAGATRGSLATYFLPVVAMLLGVTVRHERLRALAIVGVALVIAGAWLTSRRER